MNYKKYVDFYGLSVYNTNVCYDEYFSNYFFKALCEEMKKNQEEMDDFVQELDLDVEGMQSTIYFLQKQLKEAKETIAGYEAGDNKNTDEPTTNKQEPEEDQAVKIEEDTEVKEEVRTEEEEEIKEAVIAEPAVPVAEEKEEVPVQDQPKQHTRGRRSKSSAPATPTKESPKRGRPARGQKREATTTTSESEEKTPTKAKKGPGRPKRTRNARQRLNENVDNEEEEQV